MLEPGIYGVPPGADFPRALVQALTSWSRLHPPEALARATVYVNTRRMQRSVRDLFDAGPPLLLPRLHLVTDIGNQIHAADLPPAVPPLERRLELARLVKGLLEAAPDLAPDSAAFDLADSLCALMDEMQGEGVGIEALRDLDISDSSGHWERARQFLMLVGDYLARGGSATPDPEARLRLATERLIRSWQAVPPQDPIIVAGSTGSRGTTAMLMEAVARLPFGVLILPGFDPHMGPAEWAAVRKAPHGEDHPQYRLLRLVDALGVPPEEVRPWPGLDAPDPARNALVSLSLRPAPVTDQWRRDGPELGPMAPACQGLTLIEAPGPREEAQAIALILRNAVQRQKVAALVTPDRVLTRRVAALLGRWGIVPDDSAGRPLALSAPGRFLRQIADRLTGEMDSAALVSLLKHPLSASGAGRGDHLRFAREFELYVRQNSIAYPGARDLRAWAGKRHDETVWADWLVGVLPDPLDTTTLEAALDCLREAAQTLAAGPGGYGSGGSGALWEKAAGQKAREVMDDLARAAPIAGRVSPPQFRSLLDQVLNVSEVREAETPHSGVMIWGTLEARVQGADLVILGGLNEGVWPQAPAPDPWLNRAMRAEVGLLLPDRRIGLSAHDYQQAIAAPEAVLTRSIRDAEAQPVPARWLNRLTNLLEGLPDTGGPEALAAMRQRGEAWLSLAARLDQPKEATAPAPRPSPRPPVPARPRKLPATAIEKLIRDPFHIYARYVLGLRRLLPLTPGPDAPMRGQVIHQVFEQFMATPAEPGIAPREHLLGVAEQVLGNRAPWPMTRRLWLARIARVADDFLAAEAGRTGATFVQGEVWGEMDLPEANFTLTAKADRIDRIDGAALAVLDYKTGSASTAAQIEAFDKQLLVGALIAEAGGFTDIPALPVAYVAHYALGASFDYRYHPLVDIPARGKTPALHFAMPTFRDRLSTLLKAFDDRDRGYTARAAVFKTLFEGDYDHLSRRGEWDDTDPPTPEDVG